MSEHAAGVPCREGPDERGRPGDNRREADQDPTAHAEALALREAARAVGALWDIPRDPRPNHLVEVVRGVEAERCGMLLQAFFRARR